MACAVTSDRVLVWRAWPLPGGAAILGRFVGEIARSSIGSVDVSAKSASTTRFRVSTLSGALDVRVPLNGAERLAGLANAA
jgi:hypothetical protein